MTSQPSNQKIYEAVNELRKELVMRDEQLEQKVDDTYLRIQVYEANIEPLKRFVYGLIATTGAAFVAVIMKLVTK
jgi:hypothetical protein